MTVIFAVSLAQPLSICFALYTIVAADVELGVGASFRAEPSPSNHANVAVDVVATATKGDVAAFTQYEICLSATVGFTGIV